MPSSDLFAAALHHAAIVTPFCSTPFHTPNSAVCDQYKCRHQFEYNSAEQPLVLLDCITTPPATWRSDFVHTFVVAEDDLPPNMGGRLSVDLGAIHSGWWCNGVSGRLVGAQASGADRARGQWHVRPVL